MSLSEQPGLLWLDSTTEGADHSSTNLLSVGHLPSSLISAALDHLHTGLLALDQFLNLVYVTKTTLQLLGINERVPLNQFSLAKFLSLTALDSISINTIEALFLGVKTTPLAESISLEIGSASRILRMRLNAVGPEYWIASFEDLGQAPQLRPEDGPADLPDFLTGLASRRTFEKALNTVLSEQPGEPLAVMLIDLDRFKAVNDTLGHPVGDEVLRLVGDRLLASVRKTDLVARLGGDEFAILVSPAPIPAEPTAIANRHPGDRSADLLN